MKTESRKINFNAGPGALPDVVIRRAQEAVAAYGRTGMSILELPHRSKEFIDIVDEAKARVLAFCGLDSDYEVMWMQGGGRQQFALLPMNFLPSDGRAGYLDSGHWSDEALGYAKFYGNVDIVASSADCGYTRLPQLPDLHGKDWRYLHYTTNNTIFGTQWHNIPETDVPLTADMSSDIFCCERDYTKYDLFYAAAQKNLGIAGIALVVAKKSFLARCMRSLPPMFDYRAHAAENSVLNTANVFGIYTALLMLRWMEEEGLQNIFERNRRKAELVYNALDANPNFQPTVTVPAHRSLMNVCFKAKSPEAEQRLYALCDAAGIIGIKGHRSAGGFRVSLYNAVTGEAAAKLAEVIALV